MPSPEASRRNLSKVKRVRWYNESQIIKRLIWQRLVEAGGQRYAATQREWANQLGVAQQYVSKIERRFVREGFDFMLRLPGTVTLNDLHRVRELRFSHSLLVNKDWRKA
jgi:hypothetical protein